MATEAEKIEFRAQRKRQRELTDQWEAAFPGPTMHHRIRWEMWKNGITPERARKMGDTEFLRIYGLGRAALAVFRERWPLGTQGHCPSCTCPPQKEEVANEG